MIDRFLGHATECEADAISDGTHAFVPAVMEHIELAGVHSGDSACIIPSKNISEENVKTIKEYTRKIAEEMHVKGLMNMQYAIENGKVYVWRRTLVRQEQCRLYRKYVISAWFRLPSTL